MKKTIILLAALALILSGCSAIKPRAKNLKIDDAKTQAEKFINDNLMNPGTTATIKEIVEDKGLYKLTVSLPDGQEVVSYMSKDGKKFFPQVLDTEELAKEINNKAQEEEAVPPADKVSVKKDKPEVELFVMSHCPYGTQIEKGILPAVEVLGDKIDFKLKFVDYAMHGEKEIDEQINQYCINKNNPDKLIPYLNCFLKDGNSSTCLDSTKIDQDKLKSCVTATDKQFKIKESFKDKSKWPSGSYPPFDIYKADNEKYGVKGSPTLVINGEEIQAGRDSASLLGAICSGFNNEPDECKKQLSSTPPSPGFGEGTGTNSAADCGQ